MKEEIIKAIIRSLALKRIAAKVTMSHRCLYREQKYFFPYFSF